ncbi:MAG: PD-(D/E)XK nuclease family protein [DPANN group archaeon]|nr:PD-(D/E)XK nuclease family protein [DPANN group archaeon]
MMFLSQGLEFDEEKHEYTYNGKALISTTTFIHSFFPGFEEEYWAEFKAQQMGWTKAQVLDMWQQNKNFATSYGHKIHALAENIVKDPSYEGCDDIEKSHEGAIKEFLEPLRSYELHPEVQMFNVDFGVAGTADLIVKDGNNISVYDWKTSKSIDMSNGRGNYAKPPIEYLSANNYTQYALQLSLYAKLLQSRIPGLEINDLVIVHLPKSSSECKAYPVKYLKNEIEAMLEHYKQQLLVV